MADLADEKYPPAELSAIEALEAELGATLPDGYRAWLQECDGARWTSHIDSTLPGQGFEPYDQRTPTMQLAYSVTTERRDRHDYSTVGKKLEVFEGRIPQEFIPIGGDGGGNQFPIGISGDYRGELWFWDHEYEADEGEPASYDNIFKVADSFTDYLESLAPWEGDWPRATGPG